MKMIYMSLTGALLLGTASIVKAEEATPDLETLLEIVDNIANDKMSSGTVKTLMGDVDLGKNDKHGTWSSITRSEVNDNRPGNAKESGGNILTVGVDTRIGLDTIVGVAALYQNINAQSDVGTGATRGYSDIENDAKGIMLYGGMPVYNTPVSASFSYLGGDSKITDHSNAANPSSKYTDYDNFSANVSAMVFRTNPTPIREFWLDGNAGLTYSWGSTDSYYDEFDRYYDDQDFDVLTANMLTKANYVFTEGLVGSAGLNFGYDLYSSAGDPAKVYNAGGTLATNLPYQSERNRFSYGVVFGLDYKFTDAITAGLQYQEDRWGSDLIVRNYSLMARLSF